MKSSTRFFFRIALVTAFCVSAIALHAQNGDLPSAGIELPSAAAGSTPDSAGTVATSAPDGKRLIDVFRSGGPLMIPILLCSFLLVVFTFERFICLRKGRIISNPFAKKFIEQLEDGSLDRESAIELCERNGSAIARVFAAGAHKWGKSSVEVEQAVMDEGERESNHLRRYLRLINGIATVCPLLGLLGTVLGMIQAFDAITVVDASAMDPRAMFAPGISQALLTTAAGMIVAIPALIAYVYFSSLVDQRVMEIDSLAMQLVRNISAEATLSKSKTRIAKRAAA